MSKILKTDNDERYVYRIESAIGYSQEAISRIFYMCYPDINKDTIFKIKTAINLLEEALEESIYKPQNK